MDSCAQCGASVPVGSRFCSTCGAPLAVAAEVRKTVTVLFCDVVGSTELGERLDPEVLRDTMARFYAIAREPVERHGGTVQKVIGDALVAVFGVPVVHEDDALRAVRAALDMRDAVRAMGELDARIGVNTGEVLAGDASLAESLVVGDAVNVAARLEQAAPPGEVFVGEATWTLVAHAVEGERVAAVPAKGKSQPLAAWRLEAVDTAAVAQRRRLDLPMVGRESELDLLRWAAGRTAEVKRPHLITTLGQAGIGKSRLVSELPRIRDDVRLLVGHCRATSVSSSLEPLVEAVRGATSTGRITAAEVDALMSGHPESTAVAACLAPPGAAGGPDTAWALSRLIGAMAAAGPVLIVLEDVHWAEEALLDVVDQLVDHGGRNPLLVVCTARPEFADRRGGWGSGTNACTLVLERLDDGQTRRLLTLASPSLPEQEAARVIEAAEGNPLFAEHLAAFVGDDPHSDGLPRSIQVLLAARLEALPEPEREVVSIAAVAGRDFPVVAVEALTGRNVGGELDSLSHRELIEPTAPGRQQFCHALLHEAAYGLIPKQRRSELHMRLARWLDATGGDDAAVGHHLERACRLRAELGVDDETTAQLAEDAGARLAAAGRRADSMGDPVAARAFLERSLDLLPAASPLRAGSMIELAAAGWNLLPNEEVQRLLEDGAERAAEHGLRALELRARILRLGAASEAAPLIASDEYVIAETRAALRELEGLDDPRALATALCAMAESEYSTGRSADALASVIRALDTLRSADEDSVWAVAILNAAVVDSPLPVPDAERLLRGLIDDIGMRPTVRAELMQGQAMLAVIAGRVDDAWRMLDVAREIEIDLGRTHFLRTDRNRAEAMVRAGRLDEARTALQSIAPEEERRGQLRNAAVTRGRLAVVEARLGFLEDARADAIVAADVGAAIGGLEEQAWPALALSEVHLAEGDAGGALPFARAAVELTASCDWVLLDAEARLTLARVLVAAGDPDAGAREARIALELCTAKGYSAGVNEALRVSALAEM